MAEYRSVCNIPFDVDESILSDLKSGLETFGVPSISKIGVGVSFARSLPFVNGNGLCFTAKCIKNSLDTGKLSKFDFAHDQSDICGTMIGLKVYGDTDELIPETPLRIFGLGALYRERMKEYGIKAQDLPNWGTSMEVLFGDFDFWHKGQVVLKEDANAEWLLHTDEIIEGIPYYSDGSRVCIIAGGIDDDARVEFNGNALTMNPADKEAGILLAVAEKRYPIFDLEGVNTELNYTEEQMNEAKAELQKQIDKLTADLEAAQASLNEKDEALKSAEASLETEKERANKAEAELQTQATAKLVDERKQVLANKSYDVEEDDVAFLAEASQEDFDKFVKRIEKAQASITKTLQAKAQEMGIQSFASLNLTGEGEQNSNNQTTEEYSNPIL